MFKIHISPNKRNKPFVKETQKNLQCLSQIFWVEMFKNDYKKTNHMKCIVCLDVKGKNDIWGGNLRSLKNM
jgi:hypothetical protein